MRENKIIAALKETGNKEVEMFSVLIEIVGAA